MKEKKYPRQRLGHVVTRSKFETLLQRNNEIHCCVIKDSSIWSLKANKRSLSHVRSTNSKPKIEKNQHKETKMRADTITCLYFYCRH